MTFSAITSKSNLHVYELLPPAFQTIFIWNLKEQSQIVKKLIFIYKALSDACNALINNDYTSLDPIVGENACQLRAILLTADNFTNKFLENEIKAIKQDIPKKLFLLNELQQSTKYVDKMSVLDFIKKFDLDLVVTRELFFIAACYILTIVKVRTWPEEGRVTDITTYKLLNKAYHELSIKYAAAIVKNLQAIISNFSVKLIQNLISLKSEEMFSFVLSSEYIYFDERGRSLMPFFMTIIYLFEYLLLYKKKLLIKCHHNQNIIYRLFEAERSDLPCFPTFVEIPLESIPTDYPVIVVEGYQKTKHFDGQFVKMLSLTIAANAWYDPLYLHNLNVNEEIRESKFWQYAGAQLTPIKGCTYEDPSAFVIFHIYTNVIKKEISCHRYDNSVLLPKKVAALAEVNSGIEIT